MVINGNLIHMKKLTLGLISVLTLFLTACSTSNNVTSSHGIQKRKYTKGFFFEKKTKSFAQQNNSVQKHISPQENEIAENEITASKTPTTEDGYSEVILTENTNSTIEYDVENSYNSNPMDRTVVNESETSNVLIIKENTNSENQMQQAPNDVESNDESGDGKSQIVALILVLLVGVFGVHRMYLGYVGIGILQLLTLGFCGIWTLVDLILIITGDLKPKGGDYTDKLE